MAEDRIASHIGDGTPQYFDKQQREYHRLRGSGQLSQESRNPGETARMTEFLYVSLFPHGEQRQASATNAGTTFSLRLIICRIGCRESLSHALYPTA